MSRLSLQWQRLYAPNPSTDTPAPEGPCALVGTQAQVRAMVLELARPAEWAAIALTWQGVQADLGLPAPAITVNGRDGYQLWFSLARARPAAQASAFLAALCQRYLGEVADARIRRFPWQPRGAESIQHANAVPALQPDGQRWSAFVAADLAPMFEDEPWLDIPPNPDGQAELLARLESIEAAALDEAMARLAPAEPPASAAPAAAAPDTADPSPPPAVPTASRPSDPRQFLLDVMRDEQVALALRIEAAKALLHCSNDPPRPDPEATP